MDDLKSIIAGLESEFEKSDFPQDFLEAYDQIECLAHHIGRETFLVRRKKDGIYAVVSCYNTSRFPLKPDIDLLKELKAPGLPGWYDQFRNEKMLCIVREYAEGKPLSEYASERQLSVGEIVSIADSLCDILSVLHRHNPPVIHRDIKPENIIVREDGSIVLIDFDIARSVKENREKDTIFFGTRQYAAPEQYGFGQTDARTDIYAVGVLLRWLVTGDTRENKNISIDEGLEKIISRCTAFSPEERFPDVREIRKALKSAGKKRRRIHPLKAALAAAAAAILLSAGFAAGRYTTWFEPREKIVFYEPLIETAVRLQLGKPSGSITKEELSDVRTIYIYGSEAFSEPEAFYSCSVDRSTEGSVTSLRDLLMLPSLEEIHIVHQGQVDTGAIASLTGLRTIELKHMRISSLEPIAEVTRLQHAILFDAGISDASPLENCPWLETLDVGRNDITETVKLGSHPKVKSLGLMWITLDNVDEIGEKFPALQAVTLQHGDIRDPSGLLKCRNLEAVYVLSEQEEVYRELFRGTKVNITVTEN